MKHSFLGILQRNTVSSSSPSPSSNLVVSLCHVHNMADDVEMLDVNHNINNISSRSPTDIPPTSRSSHNSAISARSNVIVLSSRDNSVGPPSGNDGRTLVADVNNDAKPPPSKKMKHSASVADSKPASAAGTGPKPKSSKHSRPRSHSPTPPPPPPPPPPLNTIRLDIKLGGPEKYEVDIAVLARASGQRPPTPPPPKPDISESEGEETHDDQPKPKRKKVLQPTSTITLFTIFIEETYHFRILRRH